MLLQKYNEEMMMVWEVQSPPYDKDEEVIVQELIGMGLDEETAKKAHQCACLDDYIGRKLIVTLPYKTEIHDCDNNGIFWVTPDAFKAVVRAVARYNHMTMKEALNNIEWYFTNLDMTLKVEEKK